MTCIKELRAFLISGHGLGASGFFKRRAAWFSAEFATLPQRPTAISGGIHFRLDAAKNPAVAGRMASAVFCC